MFLKRAETSATMDSSTILYAAQKRSRSNQATAALTMATATSRAADERAEEQRQHSETLQQHDASPQVPTFV